MKPTQLLTWMRDRLFGPNGQKNKWARLIALATGLVFLLVGSTALFKSTPQARPEPLTVAAVRDKLLRVGFSRCTEEERAFIRELYQHDLAALRDILTYRYRIALARNQLRIAREIRYAHALVTHALARLKADSNLDPTRELQVLIDNVQTALQR